jgi:hypothetical protein
VGAYGSDDSSGKSHQGKSYVVFGKKDNTNIDNKAAYTSNNG